MLEFVDGKWASHPPGSEKLQIRSKVFTDGSYRPSKHLDLGRAGWGFVGIVEGQPTMAALGPVWAGLG